MKLSLALTAALLVASGCSSPASEDTVDQGSADSITTKIVSIARPNSAMLTGSLGMVPSGGGDGSQSFMFTPPDALGPAGALPLLFVVTSDVPVTLEVRDVYELFQPESGHPVPFTPGQTRVDDKHTVTSASFTLADTRVLRLNVRGPAGHSIDVRVDVPCDPPPGKAIDNTLCRSLGEILGYNCKPLNAVGAPYKYTCVTRL